MIEMLLTFVGGAVGVWGLWIIVRAMFADVPCILDKCPSREFCNSINCCRAERRLADRFSTLPAPEARSDG